VVVYIFLVLYLTHARIVNFSPMEIGRPPLPMRQPVLGFPPYCIFSIEEIEDATNNFDPSNLIAEGSQEQVKEFFFFVQ